MGQTKHTSRRSNYLKYNELCSNEWLRRSNFGNIHTGMAFSGSALTKPRKLGRKKIKVSAKLSRPLILHCNLTSGGLLPLHRLQQALLLFQVG